MADFMTPDCGCSSPDGEFLLPPPPPPPVFDLPPPPLDPLWLKSLQTDGQLRGQVAVPAQCSALFNSSEFSACGLLQGDNVQLTQMSQVWLTAVVPFIAVTVIIMVVVALTTTSICRRRRIRSRRAVSAHKPAAAARAASSAAVGVSGTLCGSLYHHHHRHQGSDGGGSMVRSHSQKPYHVTINSLTKPERCDVNNLERVTGTSDCALIPLQQASSSIYDDSDASNVYEEIPCLGVMTPHYHSTLSSPVSLTAPSNTAALSGSLVIGSTPAVSPSLAAAVVSPAINKMRPPVVYNCADIVYNRRQTSQPPFHSAVYRDQIYNDALYH